MAEPPPAHTDPFWDALDDDRLLVQTCRDCGEPFFPPGPVCPRCASDAVEWIEAAGTGTLYSFARQHYTPPGFDGPRIICIVELDEGPRLLAPMDADYETLSVGTPVRVRATTLDVDVDRGRRDGRPYFAAEPVDT